MRIPIQINEASAEPLYHQIETQLRALIISGQLPEATLLPSIREFAGQLKCSVITIRRVYQDLEQEGWLLTRQGTGTYVARVGDVDRDRLKLEGVVEGFEAAIEAGLRVQLSESELRAAFEQAMSKKLNGENGG